MQISFSLPDNSFIAQPREQVIKRIRMYAAAGFYQAGELSIGAACELAGVNRVFFLEYCKQEGIHILTQTPEELETEFNKGI
ncbi:MAG: UPF0175 family protein [Chloroflexota bacterium]